jgi:hypothetical protein
MREKIVAAITMFFVLCGLILVAKACAVVLMI